MTCDVKNKINMFELSFKPIVGTPDSYFVSGTGYVNDNLDNLIELRHAIMVECDDCKDDTHAVFHLYRNGVLDVETSIILGLGKFERIDDDRM